MPQLIATRGPKLGRCNICGEEAELTEDHTLPKGCKNIGQVELHHIIEHLNIERTSRKGRLSQNGVKYRTLCGRCNNSVLGTRYDPVFISFVNDIGNFLRSGLHLPRIMTVRTKPQKVMRALLGHLCAQGVGRYEKGPLTEPLKEYFLDDTRTLPDALKIYFWPYPFKHHVMARDCGYLDIRLHDTVVVWFLKFFPVAFLVTINEPASFQFSYASLSSWGRDKLEYEVDIPVDFRNIPNEYWPEAPTDNSVILYGPEAIVSFDRKRIAR